jgi:hypothetical protein
MGQLIVTVLSSCHLPCTIFQKQNITQYDKVIPQSIDWNLPVYVVKDYSLESFCVSPNRYVYVFSTSLELKSNWPHHIMENFSSFLLEHETELSKFTDIYLVYDETFAHMYNIDAHEYNGETIGNYNYRQKHELTSCTLKFE